jgi:transposase
MRVRDFRSLTPRAQEEIRFKAMAALKEGRSKTEVAEIFGVTRQAIHGWVALRKHSGERALRAGRRGRPVGGRLNPKQEKAICRVIEDYWPDQLKLPFCLWTREAVGHLIQRRFGVKISVWTVGRFLARRGFTVQKPIQVSVEQNPAALRQWMQQKFPSIVAQANRDNRRNAYMVFLDEAGFMLTPNLRRTWAPKGCTPVIRIAEPRGRISVVGAISISPQKSVFRFHFCLSDDNANFRGYSLVKFLEYLRRIISSPILLIWDQIAIHRSEPIIKYLHAHREITVELFPPYAPELNPVDYVWAYVKYARLPNYAPPNLAELRARITKEFRRLQHRPDLLRSFFDHAGLTL